jgi:hypothetical protein
MQLPEFKKRSVGVQTLRARMQKQSDGLPMQSGALQTLVVSFAEESGKLNLEKPERHPKRQGLRKSLGRAHQLRRQP